MTDIPLNVLSWRIAGQGHDRESYDSNEMHSC